MKKVIYSEVRGSWFVQVIETTEPMVGVDVWSTKRPDDENIKSTLHHNWELYTTKRVKTKEMRGPGWVITFSEAANEFGKISP